MIHQLDHGDYNLMVPPPPLLDTRDMPNFTFNFQRSLIAPRTIGKQDLKAKTSRIEEFRLLKSHTKGQRDNWVAEGFQKSGSKMVRDKKDAQLWEDELWEILYHMDFSHIRQPNKADEQGAIHLELSNGKTKHHLDNVAIGKYTATLIECKTGTVDTFKADLTKEIERIKWFKGALKNSDFAHIGNNVKSVLAYQQYIPTPKQCEDASSKGVVVFQQSDVEYFQALIDARSGGVGPQLAKIQFRALVYGNKTLSNSKVDFPCTSNTSNKKYIQYHFTASVDFLLTYAKVQHRKSGAAFNKDNFKDGYQRLINAKKIKSLNNYLESNDYYDFPNNLIISADDPGNRNFVFSQSASKGKLKHGTLTISPKFGMFKIIDGQHRLFSYLTQDENRRKSCFFSVTAFKNLELDAEMDLFVNINTKQTTISAADYLLLSKGMYADCDRYKEFEQLRYAVVAALLSNLDKGDSPLAYRFKDFKPARDNQNLYRFAKIRLTGPFRELVDKQGYFCSKTKQKKSFR